MNHSTVNIPLKNVPIDVKIIPVIKWLNSYENIYTCYSCQGEDASNTRPYVIFVCCCPKALSDVLHKIIYYGTCEVHWYEPLGGLRYYLYFDSEKKLEQFIHKMKSYANDLNQRDIMGIPYAIVADE